MVTFLHQNTKMKQTAIELKHVAKHYEMGHSLVKALDGVDVKINKGDFAVSYTHLTLPTILLV